MEAKQKDVFTTSEGDQWFNRNSHLDYEKRCQSDPILIELERLGININSCLEIGCADGWRLNAINNKYAASCYGIEPSEKAVNTGLKAYENLNLITGTADQLPYDNESMDVVLIGFCLYLCDREDLFRIASEVDRVLKDDGMIIILDFYSEIPYRNKYSHLEGMYSYKMDNSKLFTWNPSYQLISQVITSHSHEVVVKDKDERIVIQTIRKSLLDAYSEKPVYEC